MPTRILLLHSWSYLGTSSNVPKTLTSVIVHQRFHRDSNSKWPPRPTYELLCSPTLPMAGRVRKRSSSDQTSVHTESQLGCERRSRIRCMHDFRLRSTVTRTWFTQRSKRLFHSSHNSIHRSFNQGIMLAHTSVGTRRFALHALAASRIPASKSVPTGEDVPRASIDCQNVTLVYTLVLAQKLPFLRRLVKAQPWGPLIQPDCF